MKSNRALLGSFAGMLAVAASAIMADATADARKGVEAAYAKLNAAAVRKDVNGILALHSPDYTSVGKNGKVTKLEALKQQLPAVFNMAKSIKTKTTVQKFSLKGNEAVATIKEHAEIVIANPQNPQQTAKVVVDASSEDTWVKTAKGWLQKKSKELSSRQTVDGKEIPSGR